MFNHFNQIEPEVKILKAHQDELISILPDKFTGR